MNKINKIVPKPTFIFFCERCAYFMKVQPSFFNQNTNEIKKKVIIEANYATASV